MPKGGKYMPPSGARPYDRPKLRLIATQCGVPEARAEQIILARRLGRRWKDWRRRARMKGKKTQFKRDDGVRTHSGEGELEPLMRAIGMTQAEFLQLAGLNQSSFYRWYGHPVYTWPVELVKHVGWARAMAEKLRSLGVDPEPLKPQMPPPSWRGRYPRTTEQGRKFQLEEPDDAEKAGDGR